MDECEFKEFCDSIGYAQPCENDEKDIAYCMVRITLDSSQFKEQYTTIKECKDFALSEYSRGMDEGWNKANQEFVIEGKATRPEVVELVGETKDHAEAYANREELENEIMEMTVARLGDGDMLIARTRVIKLIRTHGKEE